MRPRLLLKSRQLALRPVRCMSAEDNPNPVIADKSDSFVFGIFNGKINPDNIFPYPSIFDEDSAEEMQSFYDSIQQALYDNYDPLEAERVGSVSEEQTQLIRDFGMFGLQVPEEYEGLAFNNTQFARISETGGINDLGCSIFIGAHQSIGFKAILLQGTKDQKDRYLADVASGRKFAAFALTEPTVGSDASSVKTKAELQEDGSFIMNGSKIWISNGGVAEIFTVFAQVPMKQPDGTMKNKMTAFIVERSFGGLTHGPPERKMGIKVSNTAEVYFDDVPIPAENVIGEIGEGFKVAMNVLNSGRFGMGSALAGTQKELIRRALAFAKERNQFGDKIYKFGAIQEKLARMNAEQYASEAVAYLVALAMDNKALNFHLEAACSKIYASERAWHCADETIQIMGGMGFMADQGVEKIMRDLRIFRIFEGTNDILRLMIGLSGLQSVGDELKPVVEALKNVQAKKKMLSSASTLLKYRYDQSQKEKGKRSDAVEALKNLLDPALQKEAVQLGEQITRFEVVSKKLLQKYNKKIIHQQFHVKRIADAVLDIYATSAALSRATSAQRHPGANKEAEINLAKIFARDSFQRITASLDQLESSDSEEQWKLMTNVSNAMIEEEIAIGVHPTELFR